MLSLLSKIDKKNMNISVVPLSSLEKGVKVHLLYYEFFNNDVKIYSFSGVCVKLIKRGYGTNFVLESKSNSFKILKRFFFFSSILVDLRIIK